MLKFFWKNIKVMTFAEYFVRITLICQNNFLFSISSICISFLKVQVIYLALEFSSINFH
ncbi:unnamed protein product [Moneuplotes crassus]|uniref:Uncharacterized protein n=1 Tax=Euplotes crassus TaxID=5936 RepID=A0AAD1X7J3_EUPCR|nr:unnamed protein product [Moneuplotes crassus]